MFFVVENGFLCAFVFLWLKFRRDRLSSQDAQDIQDKKRQSHYEEHKGNEDKTWKPEYCCIHRSNTLASGFSFPYSFESFCVFCGQNVLSSLLLLTFYQT